jgi:hypothetical protein
MCPAKIDIYLLKTKLEIAFIFSNIHPKNSGFYIDTAVMFLDTQHSTNSWQQR